MPEKPVAEKTEQPTPKKLEKARQEGQVPQSQELPSVATLIALLGILALLGSSLLKWFTTQMRQGISGGSGVFADGQTFSHFVNSKIIDVILTTWPIFLALMVSSMLACFAVSGLNFAPAAVRLQWNQINPASGLQKLFNARSLVRLMTAIFKLFFITIIVWLYMRSRLDVLAGLRWAWPGQMITVIAQIILGLMIRVGIALVVIAVAEAAFQKWKYIQDIKMTRQEVKQERKDYEGSPEVKYRIRRIQYEMALRRISVEVPKANVVLVNPTHVAVALRYESETMQAPVLAAKGADNLAEKIREIARAYGVPIVRRPELARTIYSTVKPGNPIPPALYLAVAEVLAMIYRLRQNKA